jgi:hypothetical protein
MSQIARGSGSAARDQVVFAVVLIVVGAIGLISRWFQPTADVGGWVVAAIGLGFLGAFAYTRNYGYLVPGGIMTGLGLGIVVSQNVAWSTGEGEGGAVVLGLGLGFGLVWLIGTITQTEKPNFWALIPGGILSTIGTLLLVGGGAIELLDWWGVALIAIGVLVVLRAFMKRGPAA